MQADARQKLDESQEVGWRDSLDGPALSVRNIMTIMTIMTTNRNSGTNADTWTVAEAKAKLSKLIEQAAKDGPQTVTRNGRRAAIVVAPEEWDRKTRRVGNLAEFFRDSPLHRSNVKIERRKDRPSKVKL